MESINHGIEKKHASYIGKTAGALFRLGPKNPANIDDFFIPLCLCEFLFEFKKNHRVHIIL